MNLTLYCFQVPEVQSLRIWAGARKYDSQKKSVAILLAAWIELIRLDRESFACSFFSVFDHPKILYPVNQGNSIPRATHLDILYVNTFFVLIRELYH